MDNLEKSMMQSPDLNKERLEKLKELFPDLFTVEGKLNPDELSKIINPNIVKETERFEFNWFGKSESKRTAFSPSKATLIYDESRSVNPEFADGNMIIEGENLESLKVLLSAYRENIKCIYIDPPYNVDGDLVYSDKYDESKEDYWEHTGITNQGVKLDTNTESSGRFHSNWLNMIYPRILISRQLLSNDGLIFISIGNEELHHLRKMCDEVFGEESFISIVSRVTKKGGNAGDFYAPSIDYIIVYAKDREIADQFREELSPESLDRIYKDKDDDGVFYWRNFYESALELSRSKNARYFIDAPDGTKIIPPEGKRWRRVETTFLKEKNENIIKIEKDTNSPHLDENGKKSNWQVFYKLKPKPYVPNNFAVFEENTQNSLGTIALNELNIPFEFSKPVQLIDKIIDWVKPNESDIVLDFFAGSGTTGHSVIGKNYCGFKCKFILIQLAELISEEKEAYKIGFRKVSEITIERNKRVIEKIEKEDSEKEPSLIDEENKSFKTGFKVYKLAKSNFPRVDFAPDPNKSDEENIKLLNQYIEEKEKSFFLKLDDMVIFDEVLLKNGFMLNYSLDKIEEFTKNEIYKARDEFKECLICLESEIDKQTLKELGGFKDNIFICLERSLDTTMKWNLKHLLGEKLIAF